MELLQGEHIRLEKRLFYQYFLLSLIEFNNNLNFTEIKGKIYF